jgi:glutathione S-transferase
MGTVRDLTTARNATARNATARNATAHNAITRVVETTPNPAARRQRGRVVMQIDDPDMNADAGEQLSLTDLSDSPGLCDVEPVITSTVSKSSNRKAATKIPSKAAKASRTTSKARHKLTGEAIAVPIDLPPVIPVTANPELSNQVEQMAATIATLQNRLADLRLPDFSEQPIERTQTIAEAQAIYELVEARAAARKLQPPVAAERQSAYQVAQALRRTELPPTPRTSLPPRISQTQRSAPQSARRSTAKPARRRFRWNPSLLWANLASLGQELGQRWVPIPRDPATKVVDAIVWVLVSIGLRIVGKLLVGSLPFLAGPVNLLLALPAIVAAYLAFCVANSRTDVIYRLLLTTLGLFLGSRF